jgi:exopolysaccharide production protein ExoQ
MPVTIRRTNEQAHWRIEAGPSRPRISGAPAPFPAEAMLSFFYPLLMVLLLLFNPQISPLGPAAQIAASVLMLLWTLRTRPAALKGQWLVLLPAAICLASLLWSISRDLTLRAGAQLFFTLLGGVMIGIVPRPRAAVAGVFLGFLIFVMVALVAGGSVALGNSGAEAFSGLNNSKNYFAAQVVILLVSAAAIVPVARSRPWLGILPAAGAFLIGGVALIEAHSATAIISSIAGVAIFLAAFISMRLPPRGRILAIFATMIVMTPLAAVHDDLEAAVTGEALDAFHKSSTLTGRAELWRTADHLISARPLLGQGYYTFWVRGNLAAEDLWQRNHIQARFGFNFHNTPRELAMGIGWVGFAAVAANLLFLIGLLVWTNLTRPTVHLAFWLAVAGCIVVRLFTESLFPIPFATETVLLAAALAAGVEQSRRRKLVGAPRDAFFRPTLV